MPQFNFLIIGPLTGLAKIGKIAENEGADYSALIFYIVGAFAAFYFYRKYKKKK